MTYVHETIAALQQSSPAQAEFYQAVGQWNSLKQKYIFYRHSCMFLAGIYRFIGEIPDKTTRE